VRRGEQAQGLAQNRLQAVRHAREADVVRVSLVHQPVAIPRPQQADHSFVAACEREDMADHRPRGLSRSDDGDPKHICFVFVGSCGEPPVLDAGKTAVHELGHLMGIDGGHSDMLHPSVLAHPHDQEAYDPPPVEDYGCLTDYNANQGNTYCEFCTYCIDTVRQGGTR